RPAREHDGGRGGVGHRDRRSRVRGRRPDRVQNRRRQGRGCVRGNLEEAQMKLLLTSAGVWNDTIKNTLVDLLGKPIEESNALCIPTGSWGHHSFAGAWRFIAGKSPLHMADLGWESLAVLELTALPTMDKEQWVPAVEEADVLLANGGDACYIAHHMRLSG